MFRRVVLPRLKRFKFIVAVLVITGSLNFSLPSAVHAQVNAISREITHIEGLSSTDYWEPGAIRLDEREHLFTTPTTWKTILSSNSGDTLPPIRIMPLGNSITKGTGTCAQPDTYLNCIGYRQDLWEALLANGYSIDFVGSQGAAFQYQYTYDNDHEGHGGKTADWIRDRVFGPSDYFLQDNPADIILLHIGTNDFSGSPPLSDPNDVVAEVNQILDKIDNYETSQGHEVFVILARIINRIDPLYDAEERTSQYNLGLQSLAETRIAGGDNILIVDMESAINYPDDLSDNLHPNEGGYTKLANVWFTALEQVINLPPVIVNLGDQVSVPGQEISLQVLAQDQDNDGIQFSATGLPPGLAIDPVTGEIHGTIMKNISSGSNFAVTIYAEDPGGFPDTDDYNRGQVSFAWYISDKVVLPFVVR